MDTNKYGWNITGEDLYGEKRPIIELKNESVLWLKWNGRIVCVNSNPSHGFLGAPEDEPILTVMCPGKNTGDDCKQAAFVENGLMASDIYVAGQKENKIEYMEQDSWQSKELRSSH